MAARHLPRIISLLPSLTEIVCALGWEAQLVGRSHECDDPPSVQHLPICTAPKFEPAGSSTEIDSEVKRLSRESDSVYQIDLDRLASLRPDVILTQSHCEVCAVSERDVVAAVGHWDGATPQILSRSPMVVSDVWEDIQGVADLLGLSEEGARLVGRLTARAAAIAQKATALQEQPTTACIEWIDPLMVAGNWVPELVKMAGGIDLFGMTGQHSSWLQWQELAAQDPEVICVMPCGFEIDRIKKELHLLEERPEWKNLRAVQARRVYLADGNAYFNRPGPRLIESLEILAELLHPTVFRFGHAGTGWERM